ncbi:hypothetical protein CBR_g38081 [Chara braunii]|uniref:Uncharacterized protein n=1 Tax=Chara braunii TaxID=69332 RepID=A0A388K0I1_CHABU|nr:hypothetical protein CBR_g38081 [Chara braunii]|eukprot:GBG63463.1 hypothetical protein CBR_g38081 [Chara braunii]
MASGLDRRGSFERPGYPPAAADRNYPSHPLPDSQDGVGGDRRGSFGADGRPRRSPSSVGEGGISRVGSRISDIVDSELEEMERIVQMEEEMKKSQERILRMEEENKRVQDRLRRLVRKKNAKIGECEKQIEDMKNYGLFRPTGFPSPWKSDLTECLKERDICLKGCFVPCWLFGETYLQVVNWDETPGRAVVSSCACCKPTEADPPEHGRHRLRLATGCCIHAALGGVTSFLGFLLFPITLSPCYAYEVRTKIRQKYNLEEAPCEDFVVTCLCHQLALCQEARELQARHKDQEGKRRDEELQEVLLSQGQPKSDTKAQPDEKGGSSDEEDRELNGHDTAKAERPVTSFLQNPPQVQRM